MKIFLAKGAIKDLDKLPGSIAKNISTKIHLLTENPYPSASKKLQGHENYRLRVGLYRALYTINKAKKEITILRVAHRKTIYKFLKK